LPFVPMGIRYQQGGTWGKEVEVKLGAPLMARGPGEAVALTRGLMARIGELSGLLSDAKSKQ